MSAPHLDRADQVGVATVLGRDDERHADLVATAATPMSRQPPCGWGVRRRRRPSCHRRARATPGVEGPATRGLDSQASERVLQQVTLPPYREGEATTLLPATARRGSTGRNADRAGGDGEAADVPPRGPRCAATPSVVTVCRWGRAPAGRRLAACACLQRRRRRSADGKGRLRQWRSRLYPA